MHFLKINIENSKFVCSFKQEKMDNQTTWLTIFPHDRLELSFDNIGTVNPRYNDCICRGRIQRWFGASIEPHLTQNVSWEILDKFGTLLILLINKSILLPVNVCKIDG